MLIIKKDFFIYFTILIFLFFPYVTPYSFGTDIQPWSIIFVAILSLLILFKNIKFNIEIIFLFLPFLFALCLFFFSTDTSSAIRSVLGYLTIALVPLSAYYILLTNNLLFERFLKITTISYFVVGLIQVFFNKVFMIGILNTIRTNEIRGVTSLTVEPTFYGLVCLFLIMIFISLDIENKKKYIFLLLAQIIFLSQSTMTILLLLIYFFYYILFNLNIKLILIAFISIISVITVITKTQIIEQDMRFFILLEILISNPSKILILDQSVNFRLADIYFSLKGFIDNNMLPNGFGVYQQYLSYEISQQSFFNGGSGWVTGSNRISSFYGGILFELGFIGILIPLAYFSIILNAYRHDLNNFLLNIFFINTLMFTAIPLSFTFVGIYMGTLLFKYKISSSGIK